MIRRDDEPDGRPMVTFDGLDTRCSSCWQLTDLTVFHRCPMAPAPKRPPSRRDDGPAWVGGLLLLAALAGSAVLCALWAATLVQAH